MHLPTHLALSWLIGHKLPDRRDRLLVAWAGVIPDLDALAALGGEELYSRWHHVLTHGAVAAVVFTALFAAVARQRLKVAALTLVAFHGHLLCDQLGSGPEWSIAYLYPFSAWEQFTPYGWGLASWQNTTITMIAIGFSIRAGILHGRTFAESFLPARADAAVAAAFRARFGRLAGLPAQEPGP